MEYFSSEQLFKYFQEEIKEASEKRINQLRKEIEELKAKELKKIDDELRESIYHGLEIELKELKTDHSYEMNKVMTENARLLMNRRQELLLSVFEEVKEKLAKYMKTDDYVKNMTKKIEKTQNLFSKDEVIFSIKKTDQLLEKTIKSVFTGAFTIEYSENIQIGGFLAACKKKGIEIDDTLDYLLEDKKQWFYEKSNLYIK